MQLMIDTDLPTNPYNGRFVEGFVKGGLQECYRVYESDARFNLELRQMMADLVDKRLFSDNLLSLPISQLTDKLISTICPDTFTVITSAYGTILKFDTTGGSKPFCDLESFAKYIEATIHLNNSELLLRLVSALTATHAGDHFQYEDNIPMAAVLNTALAPPVEDLHDTMYYCEGRTFTSISSLKIITKVDGMNYFSGTDSIHHHTVYEVAEVGDYTMGLLTSTLDLVDAYNLLDPDGDNHFHSSYTMMTDGNVAVGLTEEEIVNYICREQVVAYLTK